MAGSDFLAVGLGNPGDAYKQTRHNIGFMAIDHLCQKQGIVLSDFREMAVYGRSHFDALPEAALLYVAKPMIFMNRSGLPVRELSRYLGIDHEQIIVIHDDMDLEFGRIKIKTKGGHGGHKGIESLIDALEDDRFIRIRMGIGRPEPGTGVIDHVLGNFSPSGLIDLRLFLDRAVDAIMTILLKGRTESMHIFNRKESKKSKPYGGD